MKKTIRKFAAVLMVVAMLVTVSNQEKVFGYYAGSDAANYAAAYCEDYNTKYPAFDSDCTNFVSQAVHAGGMVQVMLPKSEVSYSEVGSVHNAKNYWSCKKYGITKGSSVKTGFVPTTTWTVVDQSNTLLSYGFQDYMVEKENKGMTTYTMNTLSNVKKLIANAERGDVIQLKKKGSSRYTHSYIVGKKQKNSNGETDVFLYAHTASRNASADDSLLYLWRNEIILDTYTLALISMGD